MTTSVLVLNGPGLSDLHESGNQWFGELSLEEVQAACQQTCAQLGYTLDFRETDDQGELLRWIADDGSSFDGIVINPGGDANDTAESVTAYQSVVRSIAGFKKPVIEVHFENVFRADRELDRQHDEPHGNIGFVAGLGKFGYALAIRAIAAKLTKLASGTSSQPVS